MADDQLREQLTRVLAQHAALSKQVLMLGEELTALARSSRGIGQPIPVPEPVDPPVEAEAVPTHPDGSPSEAESDAELTQQQPADASAEASRPRGPQFSAPSPAQPAHMTPSAAGRYQPGTPEPAPRQRGPQRPPMAVRGQPALPSQGARAPQPPQGFGQPAMPPMGQIHPPSMPPPRQQFAPGGGVRHPYPPPQQPAAPTFWQRPDFTSKALTVGGAIVTLVGVGLLLTLAWQSGFFGPIAQLITAIVLSTALTGAGFVVHRRDDTNLGGPALVATGVATAYATVYVASSVYAWVPPIVGLGIAAVIALGGMILAQKWSSQWLASAVVLGGTLLMIFVGASPNLLMAALFVVLLTTVSAVLALKRDWPVLRFIEVIPAALFLVAVMIDFSDASLMNRYLVVVTFALVALAVAAAEAALKVGTARVSCFALVIAVVPSWLGAGWTEKPGGWVAIGLAVVLAAVWFVRGESFATLRSTSLGLSAPTALVGATVVMGDAGDIVYILAGLAIAYWAIATTGDRTAAVLGGLFTIGTIGRWLAGIGDLFTAESALVDTIRTAITIAVVALAWWVIGHRARQLFASEGVDDDRLQRYLTTIGRLAVLTLGSVLVLQVGHLIGARTGDADLGLQVGNAVVSVGWIILSAIALKRGLKTEGMTDVYWGLGLAAAAVAKLFLVDLGRLPGLVRVIAFLVVGLCLLAIGTQYTKALRAKQDAAAPPQPTQPQPQQGISDPPSGQRPAAYPPPNNPGPTRPQGAHTPGGTPPR